MRVKNSKKKVKRRTKPRRSRAARSDANSEVPKPVEKVSERTFQLNSKILKIPISKILKISILFFFENLTVWNSHDDMEIVRHIPLYWPKKTEGGGSAEILRFVILKFFPL